MPSLLTSNRNFRWLWTGQLVSQMGTKIYLIALAWYFVRELGDNQGLATMLLAASLPLLVLGPLAGPLIDRFDRRRILIWADLASAAIAAGMAWAVWTRLPPISLYAAAFLLGICQVFFSPAAQALIPSIVERDEVQEASANLAMEYNLARFLGAAAGGVLVGWMGVVNAIVANAVSFLFSAVASTLMRTPPSQPGATSGHIWEDLKAGLRYVRSSRLVFRLLILASVLNVFFVSIVVYLPVLIDDALKMDAAHFGTAEAFAPIGSILAALILARHKVSDHLEWARRAILGLGGAFLIVGVGRSYAAVLAGMAIMGCTLSVANIHIGTYFMKNVQTEYRGRFFNLMETIAYGTFPLAYLLAGILVTHVDVYTLFLINGAALVVLGASGYVLLRPTPVN